jgi:hypothetical protein
VRDPGSEGSSLRIPHPAPRIPTRVSSLHTARSPCGELVLWSEKTTVCRIFSCKRTRCRSCRFAPVEHRFRDQPLSRTLWVTPARSRSPGFPILRPAITRDQAGPFEPSEPPTFAVALRWATYDQLACGLPTHLRATRYGGRAVPACHPKLAHRQISERRMVENTGLEPVTSWLQTRRSPS